MTLENLLSLSFLVAFIIPVALYWKGGDAYYLRLLFGIAGADVVVQMLKTLTGRWGGLFERPAGAYACDVLCKGDDVSGRPGFPSGHVATVSAAVVGIALRHPNDPWVLGLGVPWILAMAWSRISKRCHNPLQVVVGAGVGAAVAWALARVWKD